MWRRRLAGIYAVARREGWHVESVDVGELTTDIKSILLYWKPDGVIVEGGVLERGASSRLFKGVRTVYCDVDAKKTGGMYTGVRQNPCDVVKRAFAELSLRKFGDYGYVHYRARRKWTLERAKCFLELVEAHAGTGSVFESWKRALEKSSETFIKELAKFLMGIPKPCGIMAANDEMAVHVLRAAKVAGIRVPDDMAVVGIDNDDLICESTVPTLSSVAPDHKRSGKLAACLLARLFSKPNMKPRVVEFGALPLERRHSTLKTERMDVRAVRAVESIRINASEGLTVQDVVRSMNLKTRTAEKRFREVAGRPMRDEIIAARIAKAKKLLAEGEIAVNAVYMYCGYHNERSLRYAFTKSEGVSPLAWRKRNAKDSMRVSS